MSGRDRDRDSTLHGFRIKTPEHNGVSPASATGWPDVKRWSFPSFDRAGQPHRPLSYLYSHKDAKDPNLATLVPRFPPSSLPEDHLLLLPNIQRCGYIAEVWKWCFNAKALGDLTSKHKGLCVMRLKTACEMYQFRQAGPYACCDAPEFELIVNKDDQWCYGENCSGFNTIGSIRLQQFPPADYDLRFYYGNDERELQRQTYNQETELR